MKRVLLFLLIVKIQSSIAQLKVGDNPSTVNSASILELESTSKGILPPRMTTAQKTAISSPPTGLTVFDTNQGAFYYYDGTNWIELTNTKNGLLDKDLDTKVQVEENNDEDQIRFDVAGSEKFKIESDGTLNATNFNGTGFRILTANPDGDITLTPGHSDPVTSGAGGNIPNSCSIFTTYDGWWTSPLTMPATAATMQILMVRCLSTFSTIVNTTNTDMTSALVLATNQTAIFMYDGVKWVRINVNP